MVFSLFSQIYIIQVTCQKLKPPSRLKPENASYSFWNLFLYTYNTDAGTRSFQEKIHDLGENNTRQMVLPMTMIQYYSMDKNALPPFSNDSKEHRFSVIYRGRQLVSHTCWSSRCLSIFAQKAACNIIEIPIC